MAVPAGAILISAGVLFLKPTVCLMRKTIPVPRALLVWWGKPGVSPPPPRRASLPSAIVPGPLGPVNVPITVRAMKSIAWSVASTLKKTAIIASPALRIALDGKGACRGRE